MILLVEIVCVVLAALLLFLPLAGLANILDESGLTLAYSVGGIAVVCLSYSVRPFWNRSPAWRNAGTFFLFGTIQAAIYTALALALAGSFNVVDSSHGVSSVLVMFIALGVTFGLTAALLEKLRRTQGAYE
ncbi:hypothetical protein E4K72_21130 [Oxalobacteraceae bacterium OM1]|nr:hypothetical protein E4K72_21130 [Oxalobacteraceae bacterium OM1]